MAEVLWSAEDSIGSSRLEWREDMAFRWSMDGIPDIFIPIDRATATTLALAINSFLYVAPLDTYCIRLDVVDTKDLEPVYWMLVYEGRRPWIKLSRHGYQASFELRYPDETLASSVSTPPPTERIARLRAEHALEPLKRVIHKTLYASMV